MWRSSEKTYALPRACLMPTTTIQRQFRRSTGRWAGPEPQVCIIPFGFSEFNSWQWVPDFGITVELQRTTPLRHWNYFYLSCYCHISASLKDVPHNGRDSNPEEKDSGCVLRVSNCICGVLLQHWLATSQRVSRSKRDLFWIFGPGALPRQYALVSKNAFSYWLPLYH